jgi:hypothetical protein
MIRALLIYAAALTAFIVAGTLATGTPLAQVAWLVLLVEVVPLATWGAAMSIRRMSHPKRRDDWAHLGCDPVAPQLSQSNTRAEPVYRIETKYGHAYTNQPPLEAPQPLQLEAPRREVTKWTKL